MKTPLFLLFCAFIGALAFWLAPRSLQIQSFYAGEISLAPPVSYALLVKDSGTGRKEYSVQSRRFEIGGDSMTVIFILDDGKGGKWPVTIKGHPSLYKKLLLVEKVAFNFNEKGELLELRMLDAEGNTVFIQAFLKKGKRPRGDIASAR